MDLHNENSSDAVYTMIDHPGTLPIEYDNTMETKLILDRFSGIFER